MNYYERKKALRTKSTMPTMTDQSQESNTDRNVIVHRFLKTGQAPGARQQPMYADLTVLPGDLAGFLQQAKSLESLRRKLPKALQGYSMPDLLKLTPAELKNILTPPAPPPADKPKEEPK